MNNANNTTLKKVNTSPVSDIHNPIVATAIYTIQQFNQIYTNELNDLDSINDLLLSTFDITWLEINPTLTAQINNLLVAKTKILDARLENTQAPEWVNYNVSKAVFEEMKNWWYVEMLRDWRWWFFKKYTFWDFFWMMRANSKTWMPEYIEWTIRNMYFDTFWTKILTKSNRKVTRCVIVFEYDWDTACSLFEWLEEKATVWRLPATLNQWKDMDINDIQKSIREERLIEVWYYYDISDLENPKQAIIAWPTAALIETKEWEDYDYYYWKWWKDDFEPFIPVLHWRGLIYGEWILNRWFWHLCYKPDKILAKLETKFIIQTDKNFNPTTVYNIPLKNSADLLEQIENADRARANNQSAVIVNEYQSVNEASPIKIDTLSIPADISQMQTLITILNNKLKGFWINVEIFFTDPAKTATAIVTEDVSQNLAIQQFQEQNTWTYEAAVRFAIACIRNNWRKNDDYAYKFQAKWFDDQWQEFDVNVPFTRWDLVKLLKKYDFNVIVDSRSWSYPSPLLQNKIRTNFINAFSSIWRNDVVEQLIWDSAKDFWINLNIAKKEPIMETGQVQTWAKAPILQWLLPQPWKTGEQIL